MAKLPTYFKVNATPYKCEVEPAYEELAPVVHGRWETSYYEDWDGDRVYRHYHRACGYEYDNYLKFGASYCPGCGAKMDGERREG